MIVELFLVKVKEESKDFYSPSWLHSGIGFIWQKDDEHIWFQFIKTSSDGKPYVSSPSRYCCADIDYTPLDETITMF